MREFAFETRIFIHYCASFFVQCANKCQLQPRYSCFIPKLETLILSFYKTMTFVKIKNATLHRVLVVDLTLECCRSPLPLRPTTNK